MAITGWKNGNREDKVEKKDQMDEKVRKEIKKEIKEYDKRISRRRHRREGHTRYVLHIHRIRRERGVASII